MTDFLKKVSSPEIAELQETLTAAKSMLAAAVSDHRLWKRQVNSASWRIASALDIIETVSRQLDEARADNSLLNQLEAENDVLRSRALEANTLLEKALAYFRSFDPERIRSFDLERSLRDQIADYLATLAHAPSEGGKS